MRASILAVALTTAVSLSTATLARDLPDGGVTAGEVADALQGKGLKAEIGKDAGGDPKITSGADGSNFSIYFYGCNSGRCHSYQFAAGFDQKNGMALSEINKWNSEYRFGHGYLDSDNDPHVLMDADVEHGATTEAISNNVERWEAVLVGFKKFINW